MKKIVAWLVLVLIVMSVLGPLFSGVMGLSFVATLIFMFFLITFVAVTGSVLYWCISVLLD
jgi:predicted ABC-type exoprotein transport system permease subunit